VKAAPLTPVPRISLTLEEAAASLGMSLAHFRRHVLPDLKIVRSGALRVVSIRELERWVDREGTLAA
jgi:hypothetical protein